ncbi:YggS family pyridoxal phosphate-dependent enzyme [Lysobacter sp. N42]|uniref:YggS family pyridoxal phosphate-dependent enzyme n=1 Tax=Lysobacter sp. N42 TaxID=2545719 RepID=UPI00104C5627|nr:YggS family pyridoxal phosphate-dependent enzyme [Lysobacter sp. N42]TCZ83924.1 YggS family pyridoxal phosphate-dependent enzyme [Lysobacter sp. N42]
MLADNLREVSQRLYSAAAAAGRQPPLLVAVSKLQPAAAITELAAAGQRHFGENYVQEALRKRREIPPGDGEAAVWHLIGHLQSNKAREAAETFDWVQTVDRPSIATALARHRPPARGPLDVLIQVNVDDEPGKHGCRPDEVPALADAIAAQPALRLRGLMLIPTPHPDPEDRRPAFRAGRALYEALHAAHPGVDTLSMGMSDDWQVALAEGATMVRIGTALFGARPAR